MSIHRDVDKTLHFTWMIISSHLSSIENSHATCTYFRKQISRRFNTGYAFHLLILTKLFYSHFDMLSAALISNNASISHTQNTNKDIYD